MPSCFKPAGFDPVYDALRFHVAPRYTAGSAGMARAEAATRLAKEEERRYSELVSGLDGETRKEQAIRLGLSGIVEEHWEYKGRTLFRDLITGEFGVLDAKGGKEVHGKMISPKMYSEG